MLRRKTIIEPMALARYLPATFKKTIVDSGLCVTSTESCTPYGVQLYIPSNERHGNSLDDMAWRQEIICSTALAQEM